MLSRKGLSLVVAICMRHVFASCGHGTTLQPRSQNGPVDVNTFGYFGPKGPTSWVALDPVKNARCGNGTRQSPINVVPGSLSVIPGAQISIKIPDMPKGADFENRGTTVEVVAEGGTMSIGGVRYTLKQFHFHLPSEHLDNGMSMAMEVHMVWQGDAGKVAVVGFYVDIEDGSSAPNSQPITKRLSLEEKRLLDTRTAGKQENYASQRGLVEASNVLGTVLASVEKIAKPGTRVKTQPLMMSKLVGALSSGSFQTYDGSLTTPPCSEGIRWLLSNQKLSITTQTFKKARSVIGFNSRFPQNTPGQPNLLKPAPCHGKIRVLFKYMRFIFGYANP